MACTSPPLVAWGRFFSGVDFLAFDKLDRTGRAVALLLANIGLRQIIELLDQDVPDHLVAKFLVQPLADALAKTSGSKVEILAMLTMEEPARSVNSSSVINCVAGSSIFAILSLSTRKEMRLRK